MHYDSWERLGWIRIRYGIYGSKTFGSILWVSSMGESALDVIGPTPVVVIYSLVSSAPYGIDLPCAMYARTSTSDRHFVLRSFLRAQRKMERDLPPNTSRDAVEGDPQPACRKIASLVALLRQVRTTPHLHLFPMGTSHNSSRFS